LDATKKCSHFNTLSTSIKGTGIIWDLDHLGDGGGGGGGAQRPVLRVKEPKKTDARSAQTSSAAKNPLAVNIYGKKCNKYRHAFPISGLSAVILFKRSFQHPSLGFEAYLAS
jgi:hypothetical protein